MLYQLIDIQCALAKSPDYGLPLIDPSLLRVANTPDTEFLLQAELKAIKEGHQYKEIEKNLENGKIEFFKGYFNQED